MSVSERARSVLIFLKTGEAECEQKIKYVFHWDTARSWFNQIGDAITFPSCIVTSSHQSILSNYVCRLQQIGLCLVYRPKTFYIIVFYFLVPFQIAVTCFIFSWNNISLPSCAKELRTAKQWNDLNHIHFEITGSCNLIGSQQQWCQN